MKTLHKWIIFLLALSTASLILVIILLTRGSSAQPNTGSAKISFRQALLSSDTIPTIPPNVFSNRLVPYTTVMANKTSFYPPRYGNMPYDGSIIRSADALLSIGLNIDSLWEITNGQHIMLKTTMGIDQSSGQPVIKIYAHPVIATVDTNTHQFTVTADLYFDKSGNLYQYEKGGPPPTPYDMPYGSTHIGKANSAKTSKSVSLTPDDLYEIDLNNPCPPCSAQN